FGRLHADTQEGGGILSGFPFSNQLQHLALTRCQGIGRAIRLSAVGLHHGPRYARTQIDLASRDLLYGMNEVAGCLVLQDISFNSSLKGLSDILILFMLR